MMYMLYCCILNLYFFLKSGDSDEMCGAVAIT